LANLRALVLLGDILEFWVYKTSEVPKPLDKMISESPAIQTFCAKIRQITEIGTCKVFYVVGNHDIQITKDQVFFALGDKVVFVPKSIRLFEQIHLEHAHRYDLANSPDPIKIIPVGYYIARMAANNAVESSGDVLHAMGEATLPLREAGIEMCKSPAVMQYLLENVFRSLLKTPTQSQHTIAFLLHSLVHDIEDIVTQVFTKDTWEDIDLNDST